MGEIRLEIKKVTLEDEILLLKAIIIKNRTAIKKLFKVIDLVMKTSEEHFNKDEKLMKELTEELKKLQELYKKHVSSS